MKTKKPKYNDLSELEQVTIAAAIKSALDSVPKELNLPDVPVEGWTEALSALNVKIQRDFLPSREDVFRAVELIEFANGGQVLGGTCDMCETDI